MRVCFRVDSSFTIGSGHVMRCMVLASSLKKSGVDITFLCRDLPGNMGSYIMKSGYDMYFLMEQEKENIKNNVGVQDVRIDFYEDAEFTKELIDEIGIIDWLVVDHYTLDARWERLLRDSISKIMVVDDLADRKHDCELLLDQNEYKNKSLRYTGLLPAQCRQLLGPEFALLREEFSAQRSRTFTNENPCVKILVSFGSVDLTNETMKVLEGIRQIENRNIVVDVVVGENNLNKEKVERYCNGFNEFNFHCQINNMAQLMANADISLGAGGSSIWERFCLGLYSIIVSVAENQKEISADLASMGYLKYLGDAKENDCNTYKAAIMEYLENPLIGKEASNTGHRLVDGYGARRVTNELMAV